MKSQYSQKFNHDLIANEYNENVKDENNPIREGYEELLNWVSKNAKSSKIIVDLGCGTGNTTLSLLNFHKVYCINISQNMLDIANDKLKNKGDILFIKDDLINFNKKIGSNKEIDTIISTYAIHHLTQKEKHQLFEKIYESLNKGGRVIFGDLMFENKDRENRMRIKYPNLIKDFDDEFYWYIDDETKKLKEIGFQIEIKRFSDLSWGIYGEKLIE